MIHMELVLYITSLAQWYAGVILTLKLYHFLDKVAEKNILDIHPRKAFHSKALVLFTKTNCTLTLLDGLSRAFLQTQGTPTVAFHEPAPDLAYSLL